MHASVLLGVAAMASTAAAQGLDFNLVFQGRPKYRTVTDNPKGPDPTVVVNSIVAKMKAARPTDPAATGGLIPDSKQQPTTAKTTTTTTTKKTTAKTTIKTTTKKTPPKTTGKPPVKPKTTTKKKPTTTTKKAATTKKFVKRATPVVAAGTTTAPTSACSAQPILYAYTPSNTTGAGWLLDSTLAVQNAAVNWPAGYSTSFTGKYGSVVGTGYIGYYQLPYYDVRLCQERCDNEFKCKSFNIYFERDPTLDPGVSCPNPTAGTNVICTLYTDTQLSATNAFNLGQWRSQFMVVISGSNAYYQDIVPGRVNGFRPAQQIAGAVNTTTVNGKTVTMGNSFNSGSVFNPTICPIQCAEMTAFNKARAINSGANVYTPCNYANSVGVSYSGTYLGTYCQFYTTQDVVGYGYVGFYKQNYNGAMYDMTTSYGYPALIQDSGIVNSSSTSTTTVTTTYSRPFYIQAMNSNFPAMTGSYLTLNMTNGIDVATYTKNISLATKFVLDQTSSTGALYEFNQDSGYTMAFPTVGTLAKTAFYQSDAVIPSTAKKAMCAWDTNNNFIVCNAQGGAFQAALTCTNDPAYLYWFPSTTAQCSQTTLVPVIAAQSI